MYFVRCVLAEDRAHFVTSMWPDIAYTWLQHPFNMVKNGTNLSPTCPPIWAQHGSISLSLSLSPPTHTRTYASSFSTFPIPPVLAGGQLQISRCLKLKTHFWTPYCSIPQTIPEQFLHVHLVMALAPLRTFSRIPRKSAAMPGPEPTPWKRTRPSCNVSCKDMQLGKRDEFQTLSRHALLGVVSFELFEKVGDERRIPIHQTGL